MSEKMYQPIAITDNFYQLGTHSFPAYLSLGDDGMIIEGGTGATFPIITGQLEELGIKPERIKYLFLTHTHTDHIGAIPGVKNLWPHMKVLASPVAEKLLKRLVEKEGVVEEFIKMDNSIAEIMLSRGEIAELPPEPERYVFSVDAVVREGDTIDLGAGIVWTVYETPGHSPCHLSLHNEAEGTLVIGDATGFYDTEKGIFWPNYFESLENYCNSIRKLAALSARRIALSHNGVVEGGLKDHFQRAIRATEIYHIEVLERLASGEDPGEIALERAKWVTTFTALVPFETIQGLNRLLVRCSKTAVDREILFNIPE